VTRETCPESWEITVPVPLQGEQARSCAESFSSAVAMRLATLPALENGRLQDPATTLLVFARQSC
jgi:hypothetical protein